MLFNNASSCFKQYEDWIAEYTEADLPNEIREKQPALLELYEKINENLRNVRETLRPIYGKLPKSVFHGEERGGSLLMDESGHLIGLCDFTDGGSDVCINHFLCLAMQMDETLPEDYAWLAVHDSEIDRQRVQSVIHALPGHRERICMDRRGACGAAARLQADVIWQALLLWHVV